MGNQPAHSEFQNIAVPVCYAPSKSKQLYCMNYYSSASLQVEQSYILSLLNSYLNHFIKFMFAFYLWPLLGMDWLLFFFFSFFWPLLGITDRVFFFFFRCFVLAVACHPGQIWPFQAITDRVFSRFS